ncbi:MAG: hypothetical protein AAF513_00620 [Pseudomonadota bacterium]
MIAASQRYLRGLARGHINYELQICDPQSQKWLILIHDAARDVEGMLSWFASPAQGRDINLIAPVFDARTYEDYQRLGRNGLEARADRALLEILNDVRDLGFALPQRVPIFGFSAGAQFAHRFALSHGHQLSALICASAGWYTPLSQSQTYPYGLGASEHLSDLRFDSAALLQMPTLTLVGEDDQQTDGQVCQHELIAEQGETRLERARWWHAHLRGRAQLRGTHQRHVLEILPNSDHRFARCALRGQLPELVIAFCNVISHRQAESAAAFE